jgi:hypothetical protein
MRHLAGRLAAGQCQHEPANDIDTVMADSLKKTLDPKQPIREADMTPTGRRVGV